VGSLWWFLHHGGRPHAPSSPSRGVLFWHRVGLCDISSLRNCFLCCGCAGLFTSQMLWSSSDRRFPRVMVCAGGGWQGWGRLGHWGASLCGRYRSGRRCSEAIHCSQRLLAFAGVLGLRAADGQGESMLWALSFPCSGERLFSLG